MKSCLILGAVFTVYVFYKFRRFEPLVLWGQTGTGGRELKWYDKGSVISLYVFSSLSVFNHLLFSLCVHSFQCFPLLLNLFIVLSFLLLLPRQTLSRIKLQEHLPSFQTPAPKCPGSRFGVWVLGCSCSPVSSKPWDSQTPPQAVPCCCH